MKTLIVKYNAGNMKLWQIADEFKKHGVEVLEVCSDYKKIKENEIKAEYLDSILDDIKYNTKELNQELKELNQELKEK
jgi:hypothetical protein